MTCPYLTKSFMVTPNARSFPIDDDCGPSRLFAPTRSIRIRTPIPGPESRALLADDHRIVARYAHGARVIDVDENILIDFANAGTLGLGHTPEVVSAAIAEAADRLISLNDRVAVSRDVIRLAEAIRTLFAPVYPDQPFGVRLYPSRTTAPLPLPPTDLTTLIRAGMWPIPGSHPDPILIDGLITPGLSFAAVVGTGDLPPQGAYPDALTCAAAVAGLRYLIDQDLFARADQIGSIMREQIAAWESARVIASGIDHGNGRGCLLYLQFDSADRAKSVLHNALQNGLLLDPTNIDDGVIPLNPALMIPEEQLYEGLDVLDYVLNDGVE